MQNLSTHILDTTCGQPATEVLVTLYRQGSPETTTWTKIGSGSTDTDGRFRQFFDTQQTAGLQRGVYKLHFEVDSYFRYRKVESFYPFVEIVFAVVNETQHYHIPLLLNPFGYTTYRGS
ncbi:5-hydroxyisourate hydrolase isoform X2 [Anopheles cruzii]|nr:5-hydroxyisourate hydrolase isoform X2 [Anopheles cruzii]XP_052867112.1 5-hydroxyisourate hydrolase isoform X2 [Anopheles cruzii]